MIYQKIIESRGKEKLFALLLDPDKCSKEHLKKLLPIAMQCNVSMILVGGSLVKADFFRQWRTSVDRFWRRSGDQTETLLDHRHVRFLA